MSRKTKYFIVTEGSDRAIIRSTYQEALKKKRRMEKWSGGRKIHIFSAINQVDQVD